MSRLTLLNTLPARTDKHSARWHGSDALRGFHPLRRFRVWNRSGRPRLLNSYHTAPAAEGVASLLRKYNPDTVYAVEDGGAAVACHHPWTGEVRELTPATWAAQWPDVPLPSEDNPARVTPVKGAAPCPA